MSSTAAPGHEANTGYLFRYSSWGMRQRQAIRHHGIRVPSLIQYSLAPMTSPPFRVANFCQTPNCVPGVIEYVPATGSNRKAGTSPDLWSNAADWIESLTKRTEPSQKPTLAPPG